MIRALLTRIALRRYVRLGAFIAKNANLLTPLDISRLNENTRHRCWSRFPNHNAQA